MPFASLPWVSLPGGFCPCAHRHSAAIEIPILQLRESCICTHNLAQVAGLNVMLDAVMRDRARPACAEPAWVVNTLRDFKAKYKVNIPQFNPIGPTTEVNLMPNFPYKQTTLSVDRKS